MVDERKVFDTLAAAYSTSPQKIEEAYDDSWQDHERGLISAEEFTQRIGANASIPLDTELYFSTFFQNASFNRPLIKMIQDSLSKRFSIFLLSNISERGVKFVEENLGLNGFLEKVFYSCHHKVLKPEEQFYRLLLEQTGIVPEESVFIDDRQENLPPAEKLGFRTILFTSNKQLEADLRKLAHF